MDSNAYTRDGPLAYLGGEANRNRIGSQTGANVRRIEATQGHFSLLFPQLALHVTASSTT